MLPYETIADRKIDEAAWLEARKTGIGASEIAAVMGRHRFMSRLRLWAIKTGRYEEQVRDNEAIFWGNKLEKPVLEELANRTGFDVEPCGELYRSTKYPFLLASPDGWGAMHTIPIEVKTTGGVHLGDWANGTPDYNRWQLQQQMVVTDTAMATTAALVGTYGFRLIWENVERDLEMAEKVIEWGEWFWGFVERDEPPPVVDDVAQDDAAATIAHLWSEPTVAGTRIALPIDAVEWAEGLEEAKRQAKHWDGEVDRYSNAIREAIADAESGLLPDGSGYSLKVQTRYNLKLAEGQERPPVGEKTYALVEPTESSFRVLRRVKGPNE